MLRTRSKLVSCLLVFVMLLSLVSSPLAALQAKAALDNDPVPGVTRADAVQTAYEYFRWSHHDEYNDIWAPTMDHFSDVSHDTLPERYLAIECALQQGIVEKTDAFRPNDNLTYDEALYLLSHAFGVDSSEIAAKLTAGYTGSAAIPAAEWNSLFAAMTTDYVSPVQALPIAADINGEDCFAPRRYVKFWTPTEGTKIYFQKTVSLDGYDDDFELDIENAKDDQPRNHASATYRDGVFTSAAIGQTQLYTVEDDGHIKEDYTSLQDVYVSYKVIAVDGNGKQSAVRTYHYHLHRPPNNGTGPESGYHTEKVLEANALGQGSPEVWQICRDAESLRAMAWYIKGQDSGIVFDALQQKQGSDGGWSMKIAVDNIADGQPYVLVVGHVHPDHAAQTSYFADAGIPIYVNERGWGSIGGYLGQNATAKQSLIRNIDMGDQLSVGGATFDVYALPGHTDDLVILADRIHGMVFATDIYGCTRAGSADNVSVSGIAADLLLTLAMQLRTEYEALGTPVQVVFTGHDELPLDRDILTNFELALQNIIDYGNAAFTPTLRGGNNGFHAPTSLVGDMWKDYKNWSSLQTGNLSNGNAVYMKYTEEDAAINAGIDYQDAGNKAANYSNETHSYDTSGEKYKTYSVLSNAVVTGGDLVGVELVFKSAKSYTWLGERRTAPCAFPDMFNPWHYAYDIAILDESANISLDLTPMSTKASITACTLDGEPIDSLQNLAVKVGSEIGVTVTAQDGVTTSTYTFTVANPKGAEIEVNGVSGSGVNTIGVEINVNAVSDLGAALLALSYDDSLILKEVRGVDWTEGDLNLVINEDIAAGETKTITLIFDKATDKVNPAVTVKLLAATDGIVDYAAGTVVSGAGFLGGDADEDGAVSIKDLVRLRNYIGANGEGVTVGGGADINGDGSVNGLDLTALHRYFATTAF